MWRLSPELMRDDLENIYLLLFRFVGNGFQVTLCKVSLLATRESVALAPDPVVFAPWSVLLDRGEPCDSCQDMLRCGVVFSFVPCPVQTTKCWMLKELEWEDSKNSRAEEHATTHDTINLRSDDDGGPKRAALYGSPGLIVVGGERAPYVEGVTSLAVLPNGSAVGAKEDAIVVALFFCCSFHTSSQDKTTVRHSLQRRKRYWTLAESCGNLSSEWAEGAALWNSRKRCVVLVCVVVF